MKVIRLILVFVFFQLLVSGITSAAEFSGFSDIRLNPQTTIKPELSQFELDVSQEFGATAKFNGAIALNEGKLAVMIVYLKMRATKHINFGIGRADIPFAVSAAQYGSTDNPMTTLPITNQNGVNELNDFIINADIHVAAFSFFPYLLKEKNPGLNIIYNSCVGDIIFSYLKNYDLQDMYALSAKLSFGDFVFQPEAVIANNSGGASVFISKKMFNRFIIAARPEIWAVSAQKTEFYWSTGVTYKWAEGLLLRIDYNRGIIMEFLAQF